MKTTRREFFGNILGLAGLTAFATTAPTGGINLNGSNTIWTEKSLPITVEAGSKTRLILTSAYVNGQPAVIHQSLGWLEVPIDD